MSGQLTAVDLTSIDTTPEFTLGALHVTQDGRHLRYMKADGAVTANLLYSYDPSDWTIDTVLDANAPFPTDAGVVPACIWDGSSAAIADGSYAWVFVGPGTFTGTSGGAVAAEKILYVQDTSGVLDDVITAALIRGVYAPGAVGAATTGTFYATLPMYSENLP